MFDDRCCFDFIIQKHTTRFYTLWGIFFVNAQSGFLVGLDLSMDLVELIDTIILF